MAVETVKVWDDHGDFEISLNIFIDITIEPFNYGIIIGDFLSKYTDLKMQHGDLTVGIGQKPMNLPYEWD